MTDPRVRRTRESALGAARDLLLRDGLDAVTHLRVAQHSGLGRRTLYRHWPDRLDLLHDTLSAAEYPHAERTGDLRTDLVAHLEALRVALTDGPLAYVVAVLHERAAISPELRPLRDRLTEQGCAPVREILHAAVDTGALPADLDVDAATAALEGPIFYRALVRAEPVPPEAVAVIVESFLAAR
ncbi:MAG: TetR/AcrR family transcriptional regulator [Pseudonocardia sp.]|nr:TetR/AcrR family transcriptional regulator [Pseudonocardia sp.]